MGANYARMDLQGQQLGGWAVDLDNLWCPCNDWYAFGVCVHIMYALRLSEHVDSRERSVLVNRNKCKRTSAAKVTQA
ncbi:hypothetical protein PC119_g22955 [Phytophthora cactorum]|nr:hypothetical protein PC114_g10735 [Phytophthora cactorum]KAG2973271.1 hypothetical protein PC119_g22955 [Phytophthora cactorum]KAG3174971.1 hypothetical protein C6341_g9641 [Phytophthora cactorum]